MSGEPRNDGNADSPNGLSLGSLLATHSNDFGYDARPKGRNLPRMLPGFSVIIPYFNTGPLIKEVINHLYVAIETLLKNYPKTDWEVILLDDGSDIQSAEQSLRAADWSNLSLLRSDRNNGRVRTRNKGLLEAANPLCIFLDSDILLDPPALLQHSMIHEIHQQTTSEPCVSVTFFRTSADPGGHSRQQYGALDDFRLDCVYKEEWIGCEADLAYVGRRFQLVEETIQFRRWQGMLGPWALPNMALGGCFAVNRKSAMNVHGFDDMFSGYGFTETSLVTKLIASGGQHLIPMLGCGASHCINNPAHHSQAVRDRLFRQKHELYFRHYLAMTADHALARPLVAWPE